MSVEITSPPHSETRETRVHRPRERQPPLPSRLPEPSESLRIARNAALLGAGHSIRFVVGFATTILITDQLGTDYGLLIGAQRYVDFFRLIMLFGFNTLLVRGIANRQEDPGALLGSVIALRTLLGCAFVVVAAGTAIASGYLPEERWLVWVFIAVAWGYVGVETMTGFCEGYERMDRTAPLPVTRSLLMFGGAASVAWLDGGLIGIACVFLATQFLQLGFIIALSRTLLRDVRLALDRSRMLVLLREGPHYMAVGFAYAALRSINVMMLTRFAPTAEVGNVRRGAQLRRHDLHAAAACTARLSPGLQPHWRRQQRRVDRRPRRHRLHRDPVPRGDRALPAGRPRGGVLPERGVRRRSPGSAGPHLRNRLHELECSVQHVPDRAGARERDPAAPTPSRCRSRWLLCWIWVDDGAVGVARGTVAAQAVLLVGVVGTSHFRGLRIPWAGTLRHALASAVMAAAIAPLCDLFIAIPVALGACVYPARVDLHLSPGQPRAEALAETPREAAPEARSEWMTILWTIIGLSIAWVGFAYVGYPLALMALQRVSPRRVARAEIHPPISVIITVFNGERELEEKLERTLTLDYPGQMELIVASDGSTDRTDDIGARPFSASSSVTFT